MKRPYVVKSASNMPIQAPAFQDPNVPYDCPDLKSLCVYGRTTPEIMKKYLAPTPFEYISDIFIAYVCDYSNSSDTDGYTHGFFDTGIMIPVKYKGIVGANILFEYENYDYAILSGRELWGYPKKYAKASMKEQDGKVVASVVKNDIKLIYLEIDLNSKLETPIPKMKWYPHLQLHVVPKASGQGIFSMRMISRDTSPDFKKKSLIEGKGTMVLQGDDYNPLDEFSPIEILGATYEVGDYFATDENGWGKVIDEIIYDPEK